MILFKKIIIIACIFSFSGNYFAYSTQNVSGQFRKDIESYINNQSNLTKIGIPRYPRNQIQLHQNSINLVKRISNIIGISFNDFISGDIEDTYSFPRMYRISLHKNKKLHLSLNTVINTLDDGKNPVSYPLCRQSTRNIVLNDPILKSKYGFMYNAYSKFLPPEINNFQLGNLPLDNSKQALGSISHSINSYNSPDIESVQNSLDTEASSREYFALGNIDFALLNTNRMKINAIISKLKKYADFHGLAFFGNINDDDYGLQMIFNYNLKNPKAIPKNLVVDDGFEDSYSLAIFLQKYSFDDGSIRNKKILGFKLLTPCTRVW